MRNKYLIYVLLCVIFNSASIAKTLSLWDFSTPSENISASDATFKIAQQKMTINAGCQKDWPGVTLTPPEPWDLSQFRTVKLDVQNLSNESLKVFMRIDDSKSNGTQNGLTGSIEIEPGRSQTVNVKLSPTPWAFKQSLELIGMRGYPKHQKLNASKIVKVIIFLVKPTKEHTLRISNLRAEGEITYLDSKTFIPFVDSFGQFMHADWPGKIDSEKALLKAKETEQKQLLDEPEPAEWNQYGGWTKGPQLKATGFFRVEKQKDQWWLVDPDGRLFWSHGSDCVGVRAATPISDRQEYFTDLPKKDGPFADCYGRGNWAPHGYYQDKGTYEHFDFARYNVRRKYGDNYADDYALLCHQRLRSWGMNTIGNWSDSGIYLKRRTPYVATIHFSSPVIKGSEGYWGQFHDVFDPAFRQALKKRLEQEKDKSINDPWCIGYFVHNELSWGRDTSLAMAALMSPADQPAKIMFVKILKEKYGPIEKLNEAWNTAYESWENLLESTAKPDIEKARTDLMHFYSLIADTYFKIIHDELKTVAPSQLYLGCRFAWVNDLAAKAAAKYCDIVSYNRYVHSVEGLHLPDYLDKPLIIGEFHFGALDRGKFHTGLVPCSDQAQRAQKYREYVFGALRNPYLVGTHWFQFRDQALTGRGDGENYQIGLVDICDTPYPETIEAVQDIGRKLYEYRHITGQIK